MPKAYQNGRFGQIHYRYAEPKSPTGKTPLLCLHPSPMSSEIYADFVPAMGTDRLVIAADTPGYGLSDRPAAQPSIADFAAAMGDLMDALKIGQFDLFGYHTGSGTSAELACQRPKQVRRVVMNSALMFPPQELAELKAGFAERANHTLDEHIALLPERWKQHRVWWRDVPDEETAWPMFWESNRDVMHNTWGFNAAFAFDFPKRLAQVEQPILVLNPEDDLHHMTPLAAPVMKNGRIHELPGWTHGFLNAHTDEVVKILRDFLDA